MRRLGMGLGLRKTAASSSTPYAALYKPAFQGDSITAQGSVAVSTLGRYDAVGWQIWMNQLLNGRFKMIFANNQAVSGDTVQAQKADLEAGILNGKDFDCYFLKIGTNNYGDDIPATIALVSAMIDYVIANYHVPCFLLHVLHTNDGTRNTWVDAFNIALSAIGTKGGMLTIIPTNTYFDGGSISNTTADGIHPSQWGAYLMGKIAAETIVPLFGANPLPDFAATSNICANGALAGSGGTAGTGTTGTVAANWTTTGGGGGSTRVMSKEAGTGYQKMAMTGATTQADVYMQIAQTVSSGFTTGEIYQPCALVEVMDSPTVQNLIFLRLDSTKTGTGLSNPVQSFGNYAANTSGKDEPESYETAIGEYLLVGPRITIDAGVTGLTIAVRMGGNGNLSRPPTATALIKGIGLIRVS